MKIREIILESKKPEAPKPRNFVAKHAKTAGAGAHKDKKKAMKQGDVKHKNKAMTEGESDTTVTHKGGIVTKTKHGIKHTKTDYDDEGLGWAGKDKPDSEKSRYKKIPILDKDIDERVRDPEDWDEGNTEPPNNFAIYINGKKWKVFAGRGTYADDAREMKQYYDLQAWARKKSEATGKKWEVSRTGEPATESVKESATAGATSAGNVVVGAIYKNKQGKTPKNKNGTAKNALDMKANLLTGGSIKR